MKRVLSIICAVALLLSMLSVVVIAEDVDFSLGLNVSATVGATEKSRPLNELRPDDIVVASIEVPGGIGVSSAQIRLTFDKDVFEVTSITSGLKEPAYSESSTTAGWAFSQTSSKRNSNENGYVGTSAVGQLYDEENEEACTANVQHSDVWNILSVEFKVKANIDVAKASTALAVSDVEISREVNSVTTPYTVKLPDNVSATVVQELGSVELTGSIAQPVKGNSPESTVSAGTDSHVHVAVTWNPALTDNKFAANTEYIATVTVTPDTGYILTAAPTLDGYEFSEGDNGSYVATKKFEKTAAYTLNANVLFEEGETTVSNKTVTVNGTDNVEFQASVTTDGPTLDASDVVWSVDPANKGVSVENGKVTVDAKAAEGEYTITATANKEGVSGTATGTVIVTRADSKYTLTLSGGPETALYLEAKNSWESSSAYQVVVRDQYGTNYENPEITWTVKVKNSGETCNDISVKSENNCLVISDPEALYTLVPDTTPVTFTVTASTTIGGKDISNSSDFTLQRAESKVSKIDFWPKGVGDALTEIEIPGTYPQAEEDKVVEFEIESYDQYGVKLSLEASEFTWTLLDENKQPIEPTGIDLNNGTLTVSGSAAKEILDSKSVFVRAEKDNGIKTKSYTIKRAKPHATSVTISGPSTVTIPTLDTPYSYTYSATVKDQYDTAIVPTPDVSFTCDNLPAGWTLSGNTLSIAKTAAADSQAKLQVSYGSLTDTMTVTAKSIAITWPEIKEAENPVYGMTWSELVTLGNDGEATLDGKDVAGEFSIKAANEYPAAGADKTYTLVFASTDGKYTVEETKNFEQTIAKASLTVTADNAKITYLDPVPANGSYQVSGFVAVDDNSCLTGTPDYRYTYTVGADAGEYEINVSGLSAANYDITFVKGKLTVAKKAPSMSDFNIVWAGVPYDGKPHAASVQVKDGINGMGEFTVQYKQGDAVVGTPVDAGSYEAYLSVAEGKNYLATTALVYLGTATISQAEATLTISAADVGYSGEAYATSNITATSNVTNPKVTYTFYSDAACQNEISAPVDAGTYYVKGSIAATTNTTAVTSAAVSFTITAKDINAEGVAVDPIDAQPYTGTAITPDVVVKDGDKVLTKNADYTVDYTNNTNVGTATVTITGTGNYSNSRTATFTISAKSLADDDVNFDFAPSGTTYTGSAIEGIVAVTIGEKTLEKDKDYTVSYDKNINAGTATVTITGTGNYKDSKSKDFTINAKSLEDSDVTVAVTPSSTAYTGSAITGTVTVKFGNSTLVAGTDYTVSYSDNVNVGTVTVTVKGTGNFTGEKKASFEITKADQAAPTVTGSYAVSSTNAIEFTYTVNPIANAEYRMDDGSWQDSNVFDHIEPRSKHTFYARLQADSNHNEGAEGDTGLVTFNKLANTNVPGLTVKVSGAAGDRTVTITPVEGAEYKFGDGDWSNSNVATNVTGDSITVSIRYKATETLNASTAATQEVDLTKQNQAALTYTGGTTVTYGQKLQLSAAGGSGTGAITYMVTNGTGMATVDGSVLTATQAGKVTIVVTKAADDEYNEATSASVEITIVKATPTGEPAYTRIYSSGRTLADAKLTTGTITPAGTISWDLGDATRVEANKAYAWTFVPTDTVNYNNLTGTITPYPYRPSSSSGSFIAVAPAQNGTVKVDNQNPRPGETVTITVKPDVGYTLGSLTVTDSQGNKLPLTGSNGVYSFQAPVGGANIRASFVPAYENPFTDVSSRDYYYDAVLWAVGNGITSGRTATLFAPDAACTRAETLTFLWRAAGSPMPKSSSNPFTDVKPSDYYYNAVLWAVEQGITTGATATTFNPSATVSRAEVATFLFRANGSVKTTLSTVFTDVSADKYYADAVAWAAANNITSGVSATRFDPDASCTRAQIVAFLYRTYGLNG